MGVFPFVRKQQHSSRWRTPIRIAAGTLAGAALIRFFTRTRFAKNLSHKVKGWISPSLVLRRGIRVERPVEDVYCFWKNFSNYPQFMSFVKKVEVDVSGNLRWTVAGPAGIPVSWQSQVGPLIPNQVIRWTGLPNAIIKNQGTVRFRELPAQGATWLEIELSYALPVGALGYAVANVLGYDPRTRFDYDLERMKTLVEKREERTAC